MTLEEVYKEARITPNSVHIETIRDESVFYRGIKITKGLDGIRIVSISTALYPEVENMHVFIKKGFVAGVHDHLKTKYLKRLDELERIIGKEISNKRNHKKYKYLKKERENIIERYNEIKND